MSEQAKKSPFYDFLSRYAEGDFQSYMASATQDEDYLNWHGYCLPYVFTDEEAEYNAVRTGCALFDATPAQKYRISGADADRFMDYVMTRSMSELPEMRATYAIWCTDDGMLNDDAMLYKLARNDYLLMVAEVHHDELFDECKARFDDVVITDETLAWAGLAVQGAKSCAVLNSFGFAGIEDLAPFQVKNFDLEGGRVLVGRVGFTGDLGYEIWFEPALSVAIQEAFLAAEQELDIRIAGYGLTTIQLCRMEGGMIVPGWDTAQTFEDPEFERSPFELGMAWNVDLDRDQDFLGKAALLKERANGSRFVMMGFEVDAGGELSDGAELFAHVDGERVKVGTLPSVSWSHTRKCWIGLASLQTAHAALTEGTVEIDGENVAYRLTSLPSVNIERRRQVPAPM